MSNKIKIALVDDDITQTALLSEVLEDMLPKDSYEVESFNTKKQMTDFKPLTYTLIILDHHLFGDDTQGNGIMFAKKILEVGYIGTIVVLTGDESVLCNEHISSVEILLKGKPSDFQRLKTIFSKIV